MSLTRQELGRRIRQALGKTSQRELARQMQVDKNTVQNWVTGRSVPDALQIVEICRITERPIEYLLDDGQAVQLKERLAAPSAATCDAQCEVLMLRGEIRALKALLEEERGKRDQWLIDKMSESVEDKMKRFFGPDVRFQRGRRVPAGGKC